jgi:prepilin-type N-terminal cleavage/methylation domain-containing protein
VVGIGNKKKERKPIKGMTLIEALVATAIIGIGFVAVFQMVRYSVQSIGVS